MVDNEAADSRETVRADLRTCPDHHNVDFELRGQIDDLLFWDTIEKRQLCVAIARRSPGFQVDAHIALELIDRAMHPVVPRMPMERAPSRQTSQCAIELRFGLPVDDVDDGPVHSARQKLRRTVEQRSRPNPRTQISTRPALIAD